MLPRCTSNVCHVFVLVLCLSSAEDFDWTKNDRSSFYYGSFPAGKQLLCGIWRANTLSVASSLVPLTVWPLFCQDFRGVPAVQPIRQKEPGTKMEKDWAFGTCSATRRAKSSRMTLGIPRVRATTKSGCAGGVMSCDWRDAVDGQKGETVISLVYSRLCRMMFPWWRSWNLTTIASLYRGPDWFPPASSVSRWQLTDFPLELAGCSTLWSHFQPSMWTKRECSTTTTWSIICWRTTSLPLLLCTTGICRRYTTTFGFSLFLHNCCSVLLLSLIVVFFLNFRSCKRNMVDGKTLAWSTILTSMLTCASKDLATESNTGSHLTIPGFVWTFHPNTYNPIIANNNYSLHDGVIWWSVSVCSSGGLRDRRTCSRFKAEGDWCVQSCPSHH